MNATAEESRDRGPQQDGRHGWRCLPLALGVLTLVFLASLFIHTCGNDFPYQFHPDERTKGQQIQQGSRNFLHPQLLLECTHLVVGNPEGQSLQELIETGRWVSAVFAAVGVSALAWIGYLEFGLIGLLLVGTSVVLCPALVPYAHYMKEDAALVMGVGLLMLAGRWFTAATSRRERIAAALALGAAAGLATSGKYIGILALLPMLAWILGGGTQAVRPARAWCVLLALLAAVAVVLLVNHRVFEAVHTFAKAIRFESGHSLRGQKEGGLTRPNAYFLEAVVTDTNVFMLACAALFAGVALIRRSERTPWNTVAIGFTALFLAVLSFSSIPFHRYVLPVIVLCHLWGGLGLVMLVRRGGRRWTQAGVVVLALGAVLATCGARTMDFVDQFQDDSRVRLRYWLREHANPDALVAAEYYSGLYEKDNTRWCMPGSGARVCALFKHSFDKALQAGVRYAVLCEPGYDRYLSPHTRGVKGKEGEYNRRRRLLKDIRERGRLVWSSDEDGRANMHALTNPLIQVYELPGPP